MPLEGEESGFYLGTTSIGYVLAFLFVIVPVCILVVTDKIGLWTGVTLGIVGSILLCLLLYPLLLCWVVMVYYLTQANELSANQDHDSDDQ